MQRGTLITPVQAMALAIESARRSLADVQPNPPVGCVIVAANGELLSVGHHQYFGGPHAEINALNGVGHEELAGATCYVTLEPCAHYGKTPPCALRLASLPIAKVVYGAEDPNPLVAGKGLQILRGAGKLVEQDHSAREACEELAEFFLHQQRRQTAFVTLKAAASLDAQMALRSGQSQWLTSELARQMAQELRAEHQAILVGVQTFLVDNPRLDVRIANRSSAEPNVVIVIDPKGRGLAKLSGSRLLEVRGPEKVIWVTGPEVTLNSMGVRQWQLPWRASEQGNQLDLKELTRRALSEGVGSIMVEGGGATIGEFLRQNTAHRLHLFLAPLILGQAQARSWSAGVAAPSLAEGLRLSGLRSETLSTGEIHLTARLPGHSFNNSK